MLTPSYFPRFLLSFVVFGNLFLSHRYFTLPPRDSPILHVPSSQPFFASLDFLRITCGVVCFRLRVEHIWVETIKRTARLIDVLAICPR